MTETIHNSPSDTENYPQPPTDLVKNFRNRLVALDLVARVHHTLKHRSIQHAADVLSCAGEDFVSAELYEYRKTLFPPNALVDPYTPGPPVLRPGFSAYQEPRPWEPHRHRRRLLSARAQPSSSPPNPDLRTAKPEPTPLLTDLRDLINRFVVLPEMGAETLALWLVHTYAFTLRQVTTYIGVVSPEKRCGKTTLLELLGLLANRSLPAANISAPALFRVIQETQPTLLIDEADTFLQRRDEMAGILNAGYRKGSSYVVRVADRKARRGEASYTSSQSPATPDNGGTSYTSPPSPTAPDHGGVSYTSPLSTPTPEFAEWTNERADGSPAATEFAQFSCWCPKVMAAIGRLPDTLADRCIVLTMQRKLPGEKCERMRHLDATGYRRRCAEFVRAHRDAIAQARPEIPAALNDRAADIWEPLLAIADLAGGEWPALARQAAQKLSASDDDDITLIGHFLKDIRIVMFIRKADRMLSRDIVACLNPMHHRPWEDLRRGRQINEWWLGAKLRELGIRSRAIRFGDTVGKGYVLADIEAAYRRYVPNQELYRVPATTLAKDGKAE